MRSTTHRSRRSHRIRVRMLGLFAAVSLGLTALPALASGDAGETCDDPLAVLSPTGSTGDLGAVAVTSQVLEQGVEGWAEAGWESTEGTVLDSVTIVRTDDQQVLTEDIASGTAANAAELIFCGTTGGNR